MNINIINRRHIGGINIHQASCLECRKAFTTLGAQFCAQTHFFFRDLDDAHARRRRDLSDE